MVLSSIEYMWYLCFLRAYKPDASFGLTDLYGSGGSNLTERCRNFPHHHASSLIPAAYLVADPSFTQVVMGLSWTIGLISGSCGNFVHFI